MYSSSLSELDWCKTKGKNSFLYFSTPENALMSRLSVFCLRKLNNREKAEIKARFGSHCLFSSKKLQLLPSLHFLRVDGAINSRTLQHIFLHMRSILEDQTLNLS